MGVLLLEVVQNQVLVCFIKKSKQPKYDEGVIDIWFRKAL